MTIVTLKKASVLQNALKDLLLTLKSEHTVDIGEFENAQDTVTNAADVFFTTFYKSVSVTRALYDLRKIIAKANEMQQVPDLLADINRLDKHISLYSFVDTANEITALKILNAKVNKLEESVGSPYNIPSVNTGIFSAEVLKEFTSERATLKRQKQELQDNLLVINVTTHITLTDDIVEVLKSNELL